jgi:hypothetical protein
MHHPEDGHKSGRNILEAYYVYNIIKDTHTSLYTFAVTFFLLAHYMRRIISLLNV